MRILARSRVLLLWFLAALLLPAGPGAAGRFYPGQPLVARISAGTPEDVLRLVRLGLDLLETREGGDFFALTTPEEIDRLRAAGVEIQCNVIIGRTITLDELFTAQGFAAVFIGTGAGLPQFLGIPGESLNGVYSANEFLTRVDPPEAKTKYKNVNSAQPIPEKQG